MRLAAADHKPVGGGNFRHERGVGTGVEAHFRQHRLARLWCQVRHRAPEPVGILLGKAARHVKQTRGLQQPRAIGHHRRAVMDRGHEAGLIVDQKKMRTARVKHGTSLPPRRRLGKGACQPAPGPARITIPNRSRGSSGSASRSSGVKRSVPAIRSRT